MPSCCRVNKTVEWDRLGRIKSSPRHKKKSEYWRVDGLASRNRNQLGLTVQSKNCRKDFMNISSFSKEEITAMRRGQFVTIGNKKYGICRDCNKVVCVNKTFFGSIHFC